MVAKLITKNNILTYKKIEYIREDSIYENKTTIVLTKNKPNQKEKKMYKTCIKKIWRGPWLAQAVEVLISGL